MEAELRRLRGENRYALMGIIPTLTDDVVHAIVDLLRTTRGDSFFSPD
jgi:hypothetical protein